MLEKLSHPLTPLIESILDRTTPVKAKPRLTRLLTNILLYIKRVETGKLTPEERQYPPSPIFHFLANAPSTRYAAILSDEIRIIHDYDIRSASRIEELLSYSGIRTEIPVYTQEQVAVLRLLSQRPMLTTTELSQNLRMSRPTMTKILDKLRTDYALRRQYQENLSKFKITKISVVFRTRSHEHSRMLEEWLHSLDPLFLASFVFDIHYREGYIVYAIPNQQRAFRLFERRVHWLREQFFEQVQVHRIKKLLWNTQMDLYDVSNGLWRIPQSHYQDIKKIETPNSDQSSFCRQMTMTPPIRFSQLDFLIAISDIEGGNTLREKQQFLAQFGYSLSLNTIWKRFQHFRKERIVVPYLAFVQASVGEFVNLCLKCNKKVQELIQNLALQYPSAYVYLTDQGAVLFFYRPIGWNAVVDRMIRELPQLNGVQDCFVFFQDRSFGTHLNTKIVSRWNEKRQYWEFSDEEI